LSTIGVYGDHDGQWIDEESPCISRQRRSLARHAAELAWQSFGHQFGVPVSILRLSGIYGPGRNAVEDALAGRARMLIKPGQVFNRIHVHDLAQATILAALQRFDGVLNITDDEPAPPQDVICYAHSLLGLSPPEAQDFASAEISPMARSFYSENKRVSNQRSRSLLGLQYRYPNYRAGLKQLHKTLER
jgi:nucleoside-diphosphate-sugar epimerase